jgi:hypothetical protein
LGTSRAIGVELEARSESAAETEVGSELAMASIATKCPRKLHMLQKELASTAVVCVGVWVCVGVCVCVCVCGWEGGCVLDD